MFLPYLPEACQSSPGAYGFELAQWLSARLAEEGIVTGYPLGEDWGWFIEYIDGDIEVTIGCASETAEGDGYGGKPIRWRVFVRQRLSLWRRMWKRRAPNKVSDIAYAVVAALITEGIAAEITEA